ncbi:hypothetical protein BH20CHL6_BH20CHL6_13200 [soil metagenome]
MIVVLGRPGLRREPPTLDTPPGLAREGAPPTAWAGLAALVAVAAAADGGQVELVGAVADDEDGDAVAVELGRAGVGHAALLRDPSAGTPRVSRKGGDPGRLDARDIELGLRYLADFAVLVIAEPLTVEGEQVALEAASYQGAAVIAIAPQGGTVSGGLATGATVLEAPPDETEAFPILVARFARAVESGKDVAGAFAEATHAAGWERVAE